MCTPLFAIVAMSTALLRLLTIPALVLALAAGASAQSEFWLSFTGAPQTSATPIEDSIDNASIDAEAEVGRGELTARTTAKTGIQFSWMSWSIDDFVFSSSGDEPIEVEMNLRIEDLVLTSTAGGPKHVIWFEGLDGASTGESRWIATDGVVTTATGVLADLEFDASEYSFTLGPFEVPVNTPVRLGAKFLVESWAPQFGTTTASGRLTFVKDGPAFIVPPGVTVNSTESVIVDNIFKPAITVRVPQEFPTIQDAVSSVGDGSTIEISKGTYFETLDLSGKDDVTLRGKGKVVIDAGFSGSPCLMLEGCDNVRIDKLRFAGGTAGLDVSDCEGVTISKCRFEEQLGDGLVIDGCTDVVVEKCRIDDAADDAIVVANSQNVAVEKTRIDVPDAGRAADIGLSTDVRLERCKIRGEGNGNGITFGKASDLTFSRNKLVKLGGVGIVGAATGLVIERNAIVGPSLGISLSTSTDARLERNKVVKATQDAYQLADGTNVVAERNKAVKPLGRGFLIDVDDSTFDRNVASGAGTVGFEVTGEGNTFTKNKAAKSVTVDLLDSTGGANTYAPDNKFKTVQLD